MKKSLSTKALLTFSVIGTVFAFSNTVKAADNYELVWSDEFNGNSLDTNTWNYEIGTGSWGWGNNEQQYYTDRNIKVSNGTMKITAKREDYGGMKYTSSRITTKNKKNFKYGKIEARIKMPKFKGVWPAFWMLGANQDSVGWPKCGEIDIVEAINDENLVYGTLHWFHDPGNNNADSGSSVAVANRTEYHVYGVEWTADKLRWYVDGKVYRTMDVSNDSFSEVRKEYFVIFNMAIGGQWPGYDIDETAFPATMEVDWVRAYKKVEETTTKYTGPMITVTEDAVETCSEKWGSYFGSDWAGASGTSKSTDKAVTGATMNITSIGNSQWGVQQYLKGLHYYPGRTYNYSFTMTSDVDKRVFVKVAGDGDEQIFGEYIDLKARVPYNFSRQVTLAKDMEGVLDLYFGMGKCDGDAAATNSAANITLSNVSFKTTTQIPDPNYNIFYTDAFHYQGSPDGESVADVMERTVDFFNELIANPDYQDKTILIATHGCALRAMLNPLYENRDSFWQEHVPYNCAVTIIDVQNGQAKITAKDKIYYDESLCFDHYKVIDK